MRCAVAYDRAGYDLGIRMLQGYTQLELTEKKTTAWQLLTRSELFSLFLFTHIAEVFSVSISSQAVKVVGSSLGCYSDLTATLPYL